MSHLGNYSHTMRREFEPFVKHLLPQQKWMKCNKVLWIPFRGVVCVCVSWVFYVCVFMCICSHVSASAHAECACGGKRTTLRVGHCSLPCLRQRLLFATIFTNHYIYETSLLKNFSRFTCLCHLSVGVLGLQMCFSVPDFTWVLESLNQDLMFSSQWFIYWALFLP